jgi:hypothetical protein
MARFDALRQAAGAALPSPSQMVDESEVGKMLRKLRKNVANGNLRSGRGEWIRTTDPSVPNLTSTSDPSGILRKTEVRCHAIRTGMNTYGRDFGMSLQKFAKDKRCDTRP